MMRLSRRAALAGSVLVGTGLSSGTRLAAQAKGGPAGAPAGLPHAGTVPVMPALTGFVANFSGGGGAATREQARLHVLDTLASIIACHDLEAAVLARRYAAAHGAGGAATILGTRSKAALVPAVFAGSMAGHAAEINDFIPSAYVQPGPAIVSAAMALAEARNLSGARVIDAVLVGYEFAGRIPKAIGSATLQKLGLANHGIGPVFGTAMASAVMMGLDRERVNHVLAYCAQQASGSWQWLLDVRHVEKAFVFAGMGARNGLEAALMVEQGFTGVPDSFDTPGAWLQASAFGSVDRLGLIANLGQAFEMEHTAFKRYPTGGPTQPAVEALLALRQTITPDQVQAILIEMPGRADAFRGARMPALNLRYLAAIIMLDGKLDFVAAQSLERMVSDGDVQRFMKKVSVVEDKLQEAPPGQERVESARVTITTTDGRTVERFTPFVRGFPSHPMSTADVEAKAREIMAPRLGIAPAERIIQQMRTFDGAVPAKGIIPLMAT